MQYYAQDIAQLGTIVGIWAHPDDETWAMAGIAACARANGQRVVYITATYGDAGKTADEARWPQHALRDIRKLELRKALEMVGVTEHHWLNYSDGELSDVPKQEAIARITSILAVIKPDTIVSFEPEGITGHMDHKTVSTWAREAHWLTPSSRQVYGAVELKEKYDSTGKILDEQFDIYFNTDTPVLVRKDEADIYFELPPDICKQKLAALRSHASQTDQMFQNSALAPMLQSAVASEHFIAL